MIIEDFKEEIRKFIELPGAVGYGHDENGETDFMVITKASISEKTKREMILWVCGIDRKAIDFIKDFSKEELQRIEKLIKINTLKKEVEKLENELAI